MSEALDRGSEAAARPRLFPVSSASLGLAGLRLVLAVAFLAGALARGMEARAALAAFAAGAIVFAVLFAGPASRRRSRAAEPVPLPTDARCAPWWAGALRAALPSTVVVGVMAVIALLANRALAAVLAGVLGGMGAVALVTAVAVIRRERREGVRLYAAPGRTAGTYVAAR